MEEREGKKGGRGRGTMLKGSKCRYSRYSLTKGMSSIFLPWDQMQLLASDN